MILLIAMARLDPARQGPETVPAAVVRLAKVAERAGAAAPRAAVTRALPARGEARARVAAAAALVVARAPARVDPTRVATRAVRRGSAELAGLRAPDPMRVVMVATPAAAQRVAMPVSMATEPSRSMVRATAPTVV
jgi:hypothetical protein